MRDLNDLHSSEKKMYLEENGQWVSYTVFASNPLVSTVCPSTESAESCAKSAKDISDFKCMKIRCCTTALKIVSLALRLINVTATEIYY